jgi:hypothetical protein
MSCLDLSKDVRALTGHLQVRDEIDVFPGDAEFAPDVLAVPTDGGRGDIPYLGDLFGPESAPDHVAYLDLGRCQGLVLV